METVGYPGPELRRQVWARDVDLGISGWKWKSNPWAYLGKEHEKRRGPKTGRQCLVGGRTDRGDGGDAGRAVGVGDKRSVRESQGETGQQRN